MTQQWVQQHNKRAWIGRGAALLLALTLAGCGFQLRGTGDTGRLPFKTLYLQDGGTLAGRELTRDLGRRDDITLTANATQAEVSLQVWGEVQEKLVQTINVAGRVQEYQLVYRVMARAVKTDGTVLLEAPIRLTRNMSYRDDQVLGKYDEELLLYRDMGYHAAQQIMRRLNRAKAAAGDAVAPAAAPSPTPAAK